MVKLQLGFDNVKITQDGFNVDEAYGKLNELAVSNHLMKESDTLYTSTDDNLGFVGAMALVTDIIEHNYWFKNYINLFTYEDEETQEELLEEYLESLSTFKYHGILDKEWY